MGEIQVGLGLLFIVLICYVAGRLHQWARSGIDRDQAYREGYDEATRSLFHLATRVTGKLRTAPGPHTKEMPVVVKPPKSPAIMPPPRTRRMPVQQPEPKRRARHAA